MNYIKDKRWCGILLSVVLTVFFVLISLSVNQFIHNTPWFLFSSLLRLLFGFFILFMIRKIYNKHMRDVFCFKNSKEAVIAAVVFLLYFVYYVILVGIGIKGITGLTVGLLISKVILQQLTTGFYEELNYRFLICEGYFFTQKNFLRKLIYALISAGIFGALHIVTEWNTYTFLHTGAIGFAFAVIYLQSGNIILLMILHFAYDIIANLTVFIEWNNSNVFSYVYSVFKIMIAVMFVVSVIILLRKEATEDQTI